MKPSRGYESLRRHRVTLSGASYFLTLCTRNRASGLNKPEVATAIRTQLSAMEDDGALVLQSAVVMPDHLHLLGIAPGRLAIGQIVGRLKAKTRGILQTVGLSWQGNFSEHRLRPTDRIEDVLHYLFLNPYRTQLVSPSEAYPWFWLGSDEAAWFRPMLDDNRPFPSWLE